MIRLSKVLIAAAATIAVPVSTAFAQDDAAPVEGEAAPPTEDATGEAAAPAVEMAPAAVAGSWSQRIKDRPLNLLKGMIRVQGDLGILKVAGLPPIPPATTGTDGSTNVAFNVGAGYGVSDKLEVGVGYGIQLKEFEAKGPLTLYGLFQLKHSEKMRVSAGASLGYNLASERLGIAAGLAFQYHLNDKMYVYMPPTHISLGFDPTTFGINLPVGFAFQANEKINAFAETNLFDIGIEPSGSSFIFADRTPVTLGAFFSPSNKMDLGAAFIMPNVPDVADVFALVLTARLYFGAVPTSGSAAMAPVTDPSTDMTPPPM